jgi:hypothetical protein
MRFSTIATTLFATLVAAQQPAADSTVMQTLTLTQTVERVVETVTQTRSAPYETVSPPLSTASAGLIPLSNGTSTVLGTGAAFPGSTGLPESGAGKVGLEMMGLMAVAGLVGLAGL